MIGSYPKRAKRAFLSSFGGKEMFYVLSVIYAAVQLIKSVIVNWRAVSKATSISFYPEGGFGHTIHAPDILRRCHPDGSGIVFFGFSPGRHNPQVPHLFRDVRLILVPVTMALISSDGIKQLPSCVKYTIKLFDWSYRFISIIFPKKMVYNGLELFDRLENPVPDSAGRRFYNFLGYLQLLKTTTAPSIRLPSEMRGSVEELIRKKSESLSRQPSKLRGGGVNSSEMWFLTALNRASFYNNNQKDTERGGVLSSRADPSPRAGAPSSKHVVQ